MGNKKVFFWLSAFCFSGTALQKVIWGGSLSFSLLVFGAVFAWCSYKSKSDI